MSSTFFSVAAAVDGGTSLVCAAAAAKRVQRTLVTRGAQTASSGGESGRATAAVLPRSSASAWRRSSSLLASCSHRRAVVARGIHSSSSDGGGGAAVSWALALSTARSPPLARGLSTESFLLEPTKANNSRGKRTERTRAKSIVAQSTTKTDPDVPAKTTDTTYVEEDEDDAGASTDEGLDLGAGHWGGKTKDALREAHRAKCLEGEAKKAEKLRKQKVGGRDGERRRTGFGTTCTRAPADDHTTAGHIVRFAFPPPLLLSLSFFFFFST